MKLEGKVCLITGGRSGIGAATAREFAFRGADIAVCGLPADDMLAQGVKKDVEVLKRKALAITADVADSAEAVRCVQRTIAAFGRLDVLLHCAGGPAPGRLLEIDDRTWYSAFDIHVHAAYRLAQAAVPYMIEGGGGAKGAIPQFTRALARELADSNIRVNSVSPGIVRTRFQDYLTSKQVENNTRNRVPLHRDGRPKGVATALAALAENDFITGAEIPVDGGMTMRMV